jgi:hypothetical protein
MPRSTNPKCTECAKHSREWAKQTHGPDGDGCWTDEDDRCDKRRSHYKHRAERNTKRRMQRRLNQRLNQPADPFTVAPPTIASVFRIIYSEHPNDFKPGVTPIHAITAEVWINHQFLHRKDPIPCWGMRGDQVQALMVKILEEVSQQFAEEYNGGRAFTKFAASIHRHIQECPLPTPWSIPSVEDEYVE